MVMPAVGDKLEEAASQSSAPLNGRSASSNSHNMIDKIERKSSAPELPPIGIKPCSSPSYASTSPQEYINDGQIRRTRRSPLSPTSTTSSHGGSSRSNHRSPSIGVISRSRTFVEQNSSNPSSTKLETLYELSTSQTAATSQKLKLQELTINDELKLGKKKPTALPPATDHQLQTTKTISIVKSLSDSQLTSCLPNKSLLPEAATSKTGLKANKLSEENLLRLKHDSGQPSTSGRSKPRSVDTGYDTDEEKEQRIVEWLIGVESSQIDEPPEVSTITTKEKRDTAIHIVYEGD